MNTEHSMHNESWDTMKWFGLTALGLYSSWWMSFKSSVLGWFQLDPEWEHFLQNLGGISLFIMTFVMTFLKIEDLLYNRKRRRSGIDEQ